MIRIVQTSNATQAKSYYSDALSRSDYYMADMEQEIGGFYGGKLSSRMGLCGKIATKEEFYNLCDNLNPLTGAKLTPRTNQDRRVGSDINFHVPKSFSIVHALSKDNHLMDIFSAAVSETMELIEADAMCRVRKDGAFENRRTGELLYNTFIHQTARPVKGHVADMHLHCHVFVQNLSWDHVEGRYKAAELGEVHKRMPLYQAIYHKKLSDKLLAAGYHIRRTHNSFELSGVPEHLITHFSKRTNEIGQIAKEKGITDAHELAELGARTRAKKDKGMSMADLKADWRRQIRELGTETGRSNLGPIRSLSRSLNEWPTATVQDCIDHALLHCYERASVVSQDRLLLAACRHGIGAGHITVAAIERRLATDPRIIRVMEKDKVLCTTKEVLAEEQAMINGARKGKGMFAPLYKEAPELNLTGQQLDAVKHILTTKDMVSIIRGAAGSGKTTLMKEAIKQINAAGKEVITVAPTAQASRSVLRKEVDKNADTVAKLLTDKTMQARLKNQVLWVDEAGLLGVKDAAALIKLAHKQQARLVLGGDYLQHSSVQRGDAQRILHTVGQVHSAEVSKIYRQKNGLYKSAVEDLSKGEVRQGFDKLDNLGFIREVDPMNANEALVLDYAEAVRKGKDCLVIAPTHKQGKALNDAIREKLKASGHIEQKEVSTNSLVNRNLTEAEKADWRSYTPGQMVQFNQNLKGRVGRGSRWQVSGIEAQQVKLRDHTGRVANLPKDAADKFDVFSVEEIALAKGDKVRVTKNSFDRKDKALNNGQTFEVLSVSDRGHVKLRSTISDATYAIDRNFGHIAHAHCVTSHFSQGRTVDMAFVSQPQATLAAVTAKTFYVSASRAKEQTTIYTDDKAALLNRASELGDRTSAIELVSAKEKHLEYVMQQQREPEKTITPPQPHKAAKDIGIKQTPKNPDYYEPTL